MSKSNSVEFRELTIRLRDQYRVVDEAIAKIYASDPPTASNAELDVVNDLLDEVKKTEAKLIPVRNAFESEGHSVPLDLKPMVAETIQIVLTLIPRISELEKSAIDSRNKLTPHIQAGVKAVQMQNAYLRRR